VAVEKLFPAKSAKIKSRQDALQTTFSVFLDIFYPPNVGYFEENGLFQHARLLTTVSEVGGTIDSQRQLIRAGVELLAHDSNQNIQNYSKGGHHGSNHRYTTWQQADS
jgi:hypothetical protein